MRSSHAKGRVPTDVSIWKERDWWFPRDKRSVQNRELFRPRDIPKHARRRRRRRSSSLLLVQQLARRIRTYVFRHANQETSRPTRSSSSSSWSAARQNKKKGKSLNVYAAMQEDHFTTNVSYYSHSLYYIPPFPFFRSFYSFSFFILHLSAPQDRLFSPASFDGLFLFFYFFLYSLLFYFGVKLFIIYF